jgi:hypothetical protein
MRGCPGSSSRAQAATAEGLSTSLMFATHGSEATLDHPAPVKPQQTAMSKVCPDQKTLV